MDEIRLRLRTIREANDHDEGRYTDEEPDYSAPLHTVAVTGGCSCCTDVRALADVPTEEIADWLDDIARAVAAIEAELARRTPRPVPADTGREWPAAAAFWPEYWKRDGFAGWVGLDFGKDGPVLYLGERPVPEDTAGFAHTTTDATVSTEDEEHDPDCDLWDDERGICTCELVRLERVYYGTGEAGGC